MTPLEPQSIGIVIADDDLRESLCVALAGDRRFSLVCKASSFAGAIPFVSTHPLQFLVTELSIGSESCDSLIKSAAPCSADLDVVVVTQSDALGDMATAIAAGASTVLFRDIAANNLIPLLLRLLSGNLPLNAARARRLLAKLSKLPAPTDILSNKEKEVLGLIARGYSYNEAALADGTSINTVRTHLRVIYKKLGVHSRAAALDRFESDDDIHSLSAYLLRSLLAHRERLDLTAQEVTILRLQARGMSYADIATARNISINTVRSHVRAIYKKMHVHSGAEAVYEANRLGLL
jgi:DNA-binding NarL/FixJ family response regulator